MEEEVGLLEEFQRQYKGTPDEELSAFEQFVIEVVIPREREEAAEVAASDAAFWESVRHEILF